MPLTRSLLPVFLVMLFLAGTTAAQDSFSIQPAVVEFGNVPVDETVAQPLLLSNTGDEMFTVTLSLDSDLSFDLDAPPGGITLAPGQTDSSVFVSFTPFNTLETFGLITASAPGATPDQIQVLVSGTGVVDDGGNPMPVTAPLTVSFDTLPVGDSAEQAFYLINDGTVDLTVELSVSGGPFSLLSEPTTVLPAGPTEEGLVRVGFAPDSTGSFAGELTVTAPGTGFDPLVIDLVGDAVIEGDGPRLVVSPEVMDFGAVEVGEAVTQPVTLTNTGSEELLIQVSAEGTMISIAGAGVLSLAPGESTSSEVFVTAEPTTPNDFGGVVWLDSNDPIEPNQYVEIIGYGTVDGQGGGPDFFDLVAPANADTVTTLPLTLSWEAYPADDALVTYEVFLHGHAADSTVVDLVLFAGEATSLTLDSDVLVDELGYTWHVIATVDQQGAVDWVPSNDEFTFFLDWETILGTDVSERAVPVLPDEFAITRVYPNPFNPSVTVSLALPNAGTLRATVHDVLGRQVATLADGPRIAGVHELTWTPAVSAGMYFLVARLDGGSERVEKLLYMK